MRYIRIDGTDDPSGPVDFDNPITASYYSQSRTQALIDLFQNETSVYMILVDSRASLTGSKLQIASGHNHHLHVWIYDPDGSN